MQTRVYFNHESELIMSHNKVKVGGQSPDSSGSISVDLNHLSDVNVSTASNGTLVKYDSGWGFGVPGFDTTDFVLLASNQTTGGVTATYNTTTTNSILSDSRASGYGQAETKGTATQFTHLYQSGTTFSGGQNKRYSGFELTANSKFLLIFTHTARFANSSGLTVVQWLDENDNTLGPQIELKDGGRGSKKLFGYIETGATTVKVFPTCISTTQHRRSSFNNGDSWQAIKIG